VVPAATLKSSHIELSMVAVQKTTFEKSVQNLFRYPNKSEGNDWNTNTLRDQIKGRPRERLRLR